MTKSMDVTYKTADFEVIAAGTFGNFPEESIRLQLDNYMPAAIMVSSALIFTFLLVPMVFPKFKPGEDAQRKEMLAGLRSWHNLALCAYSAFCCLVTLWEMNRTGQLFSWTLLLCTPVEGTWLRFLSITFTLSKLWEWGDTLFLVALGSRPPEFLHLYHHATTFWLFFIVMNLPGTSLPRLLLGESKTLCLTLLCPKRAWLGPEKFGLIMNGGVHTLMYSHYYRSWPKPLVPAITVLQIVQLATVTYAWAVSPAVCPAASFADAPKEHFLEFVTPYFMVPVYLFFFCVFFVKRFILPKKSKAPKKVQ